MDSHEISSADVVVVGGGAVGASALHALSKAGLTNSVLIEKKSNFGRGSTGAWGSLIRIYHMNYQTSLLARDSVPYYLRFAEETGHSPKYVQTGSLYFMKQSRLEKVHPQIEALNAGSLRLEVLDAREGMKRFPNFQWMEDDVAIHEPHGGHACPWSTTEGWVTSAESKGAKSLRGTGVASIELDNGKAVAVRLENGHRIRCGAVVLATGFWTVDLLKELGEKVVPIFPKSIQVNNFHRSEKETIDPFFVDLENLTFGRPGPGGGFLGGYVPSEASPPSPFIDAVSLRDAYEAKRRISSRLTWIKNATIKGGVRAVEGYTADLNGVLKFSEAAENVLIAAGWSCTGFTLAPIIGQKIAKKLTERRSATEAT